MASLCLLNEDGQPGARWLIGEKAVAVGRADTADIVVPDGSLSREHFVIERLPEGYVLRDLHSENGTFVDGNPAILETVLHHSDCIRAGRSIFVFSESRSQGPLQP